jgi:hypothetical protein
MSTEKQPPKPKQELSDNDADRLIYEAFCVKMAFVPQTPEEVARAEADCDEESVELPDSLRDPRALLGRKNAPRSAPRRSPHVDQSAVDNLACAARNGGDVSPDVEAAMNKDEEDAEGEPENGAK